MQAGRTFDKLFNEHGELVGVLLSPELWALTEDHVLSHASDKQPPAPCLAPCSSGRRSSSRSKKIINVRVTQLKGKFPANCVSPITFTKEPACQ